MLSEALRAALMDANDVTSKLSGVVLALQEAEASVRRANRFAEPEERKQAQERVLFLRAFVCGVHRELFAALDIVYAVQQAEIVLELDRVNHPCLG